MPRNASRDLSPEVHGFIIPEVSVALHLVAVDDLPDRVQLLFCQLDVGCVGVLKRALCVSMQGKALALRPESPYSDHLRRTGEGDNLFTQRADVGDRKLSGGNAFLLRDGVQLVDQNEVVLEVFLVAETSEPSAYVSFCKSARLVHAGCK